MNPVNFLARISAGLVLMFFASCANQNAKSTTNAAGEFVNPYKPGTYEHFITEKKYPKTHDVWKNDEVLARTNPSNAHVRISLSKQRGFLMNGEEIAIDYPICSGIPSRPTPKGEFKILEKIVEKRSNRYGRIYDAENNVVNRDADAKLDTIPEGGRFEGASMRYWMRLTWDGVGHHIGPVLRRPASHACIRGPKSVMPIVYSKMPMGGTMRIVD